MIIGLDIDGVLADFTRAYRLIAHDLYGVPVHGGGGQLTWHPHDLTDEQDAAVWGVIDRSEGAFWQLLDPVITPGEIKDLQVLHGEGWQFVYVTARHEHTRFATEAWLARHGLPYGDLHHAHDKVPVLTRYGELLYGFLDDSPHGVAKMHAARLPVYVRDWPYNRHTSAPRARSVGEYLARVTGLHSPAAVAELRAA